MAINTTDENQQKILNTVSKNAHETMDKIGDIVWMLKPAENSGAGLKERMEGFLHDICSSSKISYTFSADELETLKLSTIQNKNLYLIFKEALNNALKYSETKVLDVKIATINKHVKMSIIDQGMGFNQDAIEKGNGLGNMKARATELKGVLDIISSPKMGTQIHLSFPLSQRK
jgi:signal transduction histidine kinase